MSWNMLRRAVKRNFNFEAGVCTGTDNSGDANFSVGGREYQRTGLKSLTGSTMAAGMPALLLTQGGRDMPNLLGRSQWLSG